MRTRLACAAFLGVIGVIIGSSIGLSGSFGGVNGWKVFGGIGVVLGLFAGPDVSRALDRLKRSS
jgi:uncharacterized protein YcfJ